jgi:SAM-dependent methyltransferase
VNYVYQDYWDNLHQRNDLSTVGQSALPANINKWTYRATRRNLRRFVRRHNLTGSGSKRMLEIGAGTGYWVDFWKDLSWDVDGCDLVPAAAQRLSDKHPDARFWSADVSAPEGVLAQSDGLAADGYDLVFIAHVLLHVTDDEAFARALANVAAAVKPGGHLLMLEPALTVKKREAKFNPEHSSRARLLRSYRRPLREAGLRLRAVDRTGVLASNPIEATSPKKLQRYKKAWALVASTREHPSRSFFIGPALYVADGLLMRTTNDAPTSKVLLFKRPLGES